jgi:hypothetical protein
MKKIIAILALAVLITSGCSNISHGGYYWGNYSYSYHELIKNPSEEARVNHENSLRDIIQKSEEKVIRVPPGIHAELGNLLFKSDRIEEAMAHFEVEMTTYPESRVFLERLLQNMNKRI